MSDRAKRLREAWERGYLDWKLEPQQLELVQGIRREGVENIYGDFTRRGGKTFGVGTYCDSEARKGKIEIRYATAFQSDLIEFIKPTFDLIEQDCPDDLKAEYLESKKVYKFPNGSEIKLVGLDKNPNGLRGNGIRIIVIDEAGFISNLKYLYESVIIPATTRRKGQMHEAIKIIIVSTPAEDATEHFSYELKTLAMHSPNGFHLVKTLDDIESIDDEEKERVLAKAGGRYSAQARREYFCEWIVDKERAVCATFDETKHVAEIDEPQYSAWCFAGDTGGVQDKTAAYLVTWSHKHRKVVFWDEVTHDHHTPSTEILASFKTMLLDPHKPQTIPTYRNTRNFLDASGQLLIDYAQAGFDAALPPKDEFHAGLTMIRNAFYNDEILIHPRCKLLIASLRSGLLNKQRTDYQRTINLGHCDAVAAAIYALRVVDRLTNTEPGPSKHDTFALQRKKPHPLTKLGYTQD